MSAPLREKPLTSRTPYRQSSSSTPVSAHHGNPFGSSYRSEWVKGRGDAPGFVEDVRIWHTEIAMFLNLAVKDWQHEQKITFGARLRFPRHSFCREAGSPSHSGQAGVALLHDSVERGVDLGANIAKAELAGATADNLKPQ